MYVHSVKLVNFKSFGDYSESTIILEPGVTAIIGKNESGKSNILDGLSQICFDKRNNRAFSSELINRSLSTGGENEYIITLKSTNEDRLFDIIEDTTIRITQNSYVATGGFLSALIQRVQPDTDAVLEILEELGTNPMQLTDQDYTNYRMYFNELRTKDKIDIPVRSAAFEFLKKRIGKISKDKQESLNNKLDLAKENWIKLVNLLPVFFYRKFDKRLNTVYRVEDIEKELKSPSETANSLLSAFVRLIGIPTDDFIYACRPGTTAKQESLRRKINKLVNEKINRPFQNFYMTETIYMDLGFNGGKVSFVVQSEDGEALLLSERSNGLRWYLETFIDAQASNVLNRNSVYLLDEPGVSLHVNAQRELLKLFKHLATQGNQVVYTTHSPYMLDLESSGIHRIRAVVKNREGMSFIYKSAYDARIAPESQKDTLAPIINAIGMNLNDTFGPAKDKINIVTEGISDYIYLCMMAKELGINTKKYAIIPSVGASNCVNICSILHGWGCRYVALFDYDKAGVQTGGEYLRKEMMLTYKSNYFYLSDVSQEEVNQKTYKHSPHRIEDVVTDEEIDRFCMETNTAKSIGKSLMAKVMSNAVELGDYQIGNECRENFQELFNRILSDFEK